MTYMHRLLPLNIENHIYYIASKHKIMVYRENNHKYGNQLSPLILDITLYRIHVSQCWTITNFQ